MTARMWSSNWLAGQASMVQWPELWGRGAISLTRTRPWRSTNISTAREADEVEGFGDSPGDAGGFGGGVGGDAGGGEGEVEDAVAVAVLHGVEEGAAAVLAAGDDDADLAGVVDEAFEDEGFGVEGGPGGGRVGLGSGGRLGLCRRSRGGWFSGRRGGRSSAVASCRAVSVVDGAPGGGGDAGVAEEGFLGDAVLADA